jgi:hypothetical protein
LNTDGQVVGILTLGSETDSGGGNFNYFLPASLVTEMLSNANVKLDTGRSVTNAYHEAVALLESGNCSAGKVAMSGLQNSLDSDFINQILTSCNPSEAHIQLNAWWAGMIALLVILIAVISFWYHRRMAVKKEIVVQPVAVPPTTTKTPTQGNP